MTERFHNTGLTTLNGAITALSSSLVLTSALTFPTSGTFRLLIGSEILLVTSITGATCTVTRGTEGTTAAAHASGVDVLAVITEAAVAQFKADILAAAAIAGCCTLEQFGAVGDGVTSDQPALDLAMAAINAGTYKALQLGAGKTYLVTTGTGTLPVGTTIAGYGPTSVLKTATNHAVITLSGSEDCALLNFAIRGNAISTAQIGIQAGISGSGVGQARLHIQGVDIQQTYYGMVFSRSNGSQGIGPIVTGCHISGTGYAAVTQESSEFVRFIGCDFSANSTGLKIGSGNIVFVGGNLDYNGKAIELVGGSNDSHGIVSGSSINHSSADGISCVGTTNGFRIIGCNLFQTAFTIKDNTKPVVFVGCHIDPQVITFDNAWVRFQACTVGTDYYVGPYTELNNPDVEWCDDTRSQNTSLPAHVVDRQQVAFTFTADASQTLTKAQSRAQIIDVQAGVISAGRTITSTLSPTKGRTIIVRNGTAQTVTYAWSSGTGVAVAPGKQAIVGADSTNAIALLVGA